MDMQRRSTPHEQGRERAGTDFFYQRETGSTVAWGAIIAGGAAAAALSLILLILGTGLGLSAVSPWAQDGISARAFGVSTIIWLTVTQVLAAGMGGFLAGRLRGAWLDAQEDEVYFRDSAHGFLSWAVASLATAALLTSAVGGIVGVGVQSAGQVVASAPAALMGVKGGSDKSGLSGLSGLSGSSNSSDGSSASEGDSTIDYVVDSLFRPAADANAAAADARSAPAAIEVARIFTHALGNGALGAEDLRYLGQRVAERSGLAQADAERRVTEVFARLQTTTQNTEAKAKEAADEARKASAYAALWLFISLLLGAFVASAAAIFGGRQRDL